MSSRVSPGPDGGRATPIAWRTVGAGGSQPILFGASSPAPGEISDVECRIAQQVQEAHAAGVREGEAGGQARAALELQPVMERLSRSIEEMGGLRARLRREAEKDLVRLSLAIARRILRRELMIDPEAMHGLVLGALEKLQSQEICRARVHPSQAGLVTACLERRVGDVKVEVLADPSCEPGAVILETERGSLDASVESQLQEIERGLTDRLQRRE